MLSRSLVERVTQVMIGVTAICAALAHFLYRPGSPDRPSGVIGTVVASLLLVVAMFVPISLAVLRAAIARWSPETWPVPRRDYSAVAVALCTFFFPITASIGRAAWGPLQPIGRSLTIHFTVLSALIIWGILHIRAHPRRETMR
jgi:hypothetical protein